MVATALHDGHVRITLLPVQAGERFKTCTECGAEGIESPTACRSSFYWRSRKTRRFESRCKRCSKTCATEYQRRTGCKREYAREMYKRFAQDPVAHEAFKVKQRRYGAVYRETHKEELRIDGKLERERRGPKVRVATVPKSTHSGAKLPIGPFRAWLLELVAEEARMHDPKEARRRVGDRLQLSEKRLREYLTNRPYVYESAVDHAVSREGSRTVQDLYPKGVDTTMPERPTLQLVAERVRCVSRGCEEPPVGGAKFCALHGEPLARIRGELQAEGALMSANGGASLAESAKKRGEVGTCCNPHCWNPRLTGRRFCDECEADGYSEEELL